jgi:large subunit ribosomal protein L29
MATKAKDATVVKSVDELKAELQTKRTDLLEAHRSHAAGELVNPKVLGVYRKEIARLLTQINAKESK